MYFLPLFLYLPHTSHYRTCLPMYPAWSYTTLALTLRPQSLLTTTSQKTGLIVGRILVLVWQGLEGMVILHMGVQMNIFCILVRLESASNFEAPPLTSTRLVLSVSNSPCEQILSLKKKRVQPPKSAIFENSSTTSEFSLPFAKKSSKRKPEAGNDLRRSKRKKNNTDDVFL